MLIAILVLVLTVMIVGYGFYLRNDDAKRYKAAIEEHRLVKNAPSGFQGANRPDFVDQHLWEVLDD